MPLSRDAASILKSLTERPALYSEVELELRALRTLNTSLRSRFGEQYFPEILTDAVTRHVIAQTELVSKLPPACPSREVLLAAGCADRRPPPPTLVLLHFPWFRVHTGHVRVWTLLHVMQYHCLMDALNMRLVMMVQPGELASCQRICRPSGAGTHRYCRCHKAEHDRAYNQRNVAEFALGREHILYAHADAFLNLPSWGRHILQSGNATMLPNSGLHGTTYMPTPNACVNATDSALNASKRWFWHLDARPKCRQAANGMKPAELGGVAGHTRWMRQPLCCYGWADVAFLPMHAQAAFRKAVRNSFWDVQCEVAFPTVFKALEIARVATHRPISCSGGCCQKLNWSPSMSSGLCAHRVDLEVASLQGVPPQLIAPLLCQRRFGDRPGDRGGGGRGGGAAGGAGRAHAMLDRHAMRLAMKQKLLSRGHGHEIGRGSHTYRG